MKFKLEIDLSTSCEMSDHHDVAAALKALGDRLDRFVSSGWSPYALSGEVRDRDKRVVGRWEVVADPDVVALVDSIVVIQESREDKS